MFAEAPQLRKHLAEAFAGVPCPHPELENLDHDKLLELSMMLNGSLPDESFHYVLPRVLEDILNYGPGLVSDLEFEWLIYSLNVFSVLPPGRARLIEQKKAKFARFTPEQTAALTEWLLIIREWNERAVTVMLEDIDAALTYWVER